MAMGNDAISARQRSKLSIVILIFFVGLGALLTNVFTYTNNYNNPPIRSDGFGYYLYLPAIFIYHDVRFRFIPKAIHSGALKSYPTKTFSWAGLTKNGSGYLNKYPCGTALMQLPFFLPALWMADFIYGHPNGFESVFQYANVISAMFFLCFGSAILFLICAEDGYEWLSLGLVAFSIFGTNALHYGSYDGSFSHIYCFFLSCVSAYLVFNKRNKLPVARYYGLLGAVIGLAVIVRPTNALWIPLALISAPNNLRDIVRSTVAFSLGLFIALLPQLLLWFITTGGVIVYSYGSERFNFLSPHLMSYLFSVQKGVFFWHPAYLVLTFGTLVAAFRGRRGALVLFVIVFISHYVNSSWHGWSFGGSFGARPAVDTLAFLVVGSGLALKKCRKSPKLFALAVAPMSLLVAVNLIQAHGYIIHRIPYGGTTWSSYVAFWQNML